ncbi:TPA: hypothetical protein HA241_00820 [Candidatus Woesearchaeota archaeon]|nr:hypothetical protein [Candidatus Woesearchaeota archaeon]
MDEAVLFKLGLNRNEARVYLTLLRSGSSSAGRLIKTTEFHRNIVYDNLEKLIDRGLVSFVLEGKKKIFTINNPNALLDMLEKEQEKLTERKTLAMELKKEITLIQSTQQEEQQATIFRGIRGIKALFMNTLQEGKDYYVFGAPKESLTIMGDTFWENYNLKRSHQKMIVKMIFNDDLREWSQTIKSRLTQIRFLPQKFDSLSETMIYGSNVAIIIWTEKPIATLIKDKNLAESYKQYFQILWKEAKE